MAKRIAKVQKQSVTVETVTEKRCRLRKTSITFRVTLTEEQKLAKAKALENDVVVFTGEPGTSKSLISCNIALDLLLSGRVGKIIVTRPMVDVGKSMGFLPGIENSFSEGKSAPYLAPVLQAMCKLRSQAEIMKLIETKKIEVVPIQFVRGLNFEDCCVIVDK